MPYVIGTWSPVVTLVFCGVGLDFSTVCCTCKSVPNPCDILARAQYHSTTLTQHRSTGIYDTEMWVLGDR